MAQPRYLGKTEMRVLGGRVGRRGFAAMIGVLIIGSIGMVTSLTSAMIFMQESREISKRADAVQARASAYSCAQVAVLKLKKNSGYAGNENISNGSVSCSIGAVVVNGSARTIYAQAAVNGLVSRIKVEFTGINTSQFYLNSWTEIPPI